MATQATIQIVNKNVDKMFTDVVAEYNLKSGDIAPEQVFELKRLKRQLAELLGDYLYNNLEIHDSRTCINSKPCFDCEGGSR